MADTAMTVAEESTYRSLPDVLADCQSDCWAEQSALPNDFRHFCFLTTEAEQNGRVTRILGNDKGAAEKRVGTV